MKEQTGWLKCKKKIMCWFVHRDLFVQFYDQLCVWISPNKTCCTTIIIPLVCYFLRLQQGILKTEFRGHEFWNFFLFFFFTRCCNWSFNPFMLDINVTEVWALKTVKSTVLLKFVPLLLDELLWVLQLWPTCYSFKHLMIWGKNNWSYKLRYSLKALEQQVTVQIQIQKFI